MKRLLVNSLVAFCIVLVGCEKKSTESPGKPDSLAPETPKPGAEAQKPPAGPGHGGGIIELGTTKVGDLAVRATRDEGEIKPGGDAPIDIWLTTDAGEPALVSAVRFWIGTEDAKGSIKAKAEIEDPKQTNHWHTHGEVPDPLPAGSKLWVEIEGKDAKKTVASFDLKA